ncbi:hypothetical protein MUO83_07285 [Candidatus Bathyarchaeota archaeon]|nr:hypothetical protein [Candidatus Bathyarchaeota archaeon]
MEVKMEHEKGKTQCVFKKTQVTISRVNTAIIVWMMRKHEAGQPTAAV